MPFECASCDKLFPDKGRLERHILRHVDPSKRHQPLSLKKPNPNTVTPGRTCKQLTNFVPNYTMRNAIHECSICLKKFHRRDDMRKHKREVHTAKPPPKFSSKNRTRNSLGRREKYECPCGKQFTNRELLLKHRMKFHPDWVHKCRQCDRIFNTPIQLAYHVDKAHPRTTYKCSKCNETLKTMVGMYNHRTKGCRMPKVMSKMLPKVVKVEPGVPKPKFFSCSFCQGKFAGLPALENHINMHLQRSEEIDNREVSRKLLLQIMQNEPKLSNANETSESTAAVMVPDLDANAPPAKIKVPRKNEMKKVNLVQCPKCDMNMPPLQWTMHSNLHNKPDRPKCTICNYVAASETKMKDHMQNHADVTAPFFCSVCHLNFREVYWAEKHVNAYHGTKAKVENRPSASNVGEGKNSVEGKEAKILKNSGPTVKKCSMCNNVYSDYSELNFHMMEAHIKKEGNQQCHFCSTKLENFNLMVTHLKLQHCVHVKIPRSCKICNLVLNNSYSLNRHLQLMHPECPYCKERQASKASLVSHVSMKHPSLPESQSAYSETPNDFVPVAVKEEKPDGEIQDTQIAACFYGEGSGHELNRPEQTTIMKLEDLLKSKLVKTVEDAHHGVAAGTSKEAEPNGNVQLPLQHQVNHGPAKKQSKAKQSVPKTPKSKEQPVARKIKSFIPTSPSETSNSSTSTVDPMIGAVRSSVKYIRKKCHVCSARFNTVGECRSHLVNLHNMCCNCDEMFVTQDELQKHIENHPTLICPICNRTLNKPKELQIHISRAHQDSAACSVCFIVFDNLVDLKAHHDHEHPFMKQCPVCNHFMNQSNVASHMRKHDANSQNFSCQICKKEFKNKSNLDQHLRIHTGDKPYQCPVCPEKFFVGPKMVQHAKNVHGFNDKSNLLTCPWCSTIVSSITELGRHVNTVKECGDKRDLQSVILSTNNVPIKIENGSPEKNSETV